MCHGGTRGDRALVRERCRRAACCRACALALCAERWTPAGPACSFVKSHITEEWTATRRGARLGATRDAGPGPDE
eukprot:4843775-Prymnesium_polylepis.1